MFSCVDVVAVVVPCCRHHNVCITVAVVAVVVVAAVVAAALVMPRFAHGSCGLSSLFAQFSNQFCLLFMQQQLLRHTHGHFSPQLQHQRLSLCVCVCFAVSVCASLTTFLWFGTHPKPKDNNKLVNVFGKVHRQATAADMETDRQTERQAGKQLDRSRSSSSVTVNYTFHNFRYIFRDNRM